MFLNTMQIVQPFYIMLLDWLIISNYPALLALKPALLEQAIELSRQARFPLEQLLLNTSILRYRREY